MLWHHGILVHTKSPSMWNCLTFLGLQLCCMEEHDSEGNTWHCRGTDYKSYWLFAMHLIRCPIYFFPVRLYTSSNYREAYIRSAAWENFSRPMVNLRNELDQDKPFDGLSLFLKLLSSERGLYHNHLCSVKHSLRWLGNTGKQKNYAPDEPNVSAWD